MTNAIEGEVVATDDEIPPGHYIVPMAGRPILVKEINPAQRMVLGNIFRQAKNASNHDGVMMMFGKLFSLMENLIAKPQDREYLEEQIIAGNLDVADFAIVWEGHAQPADSEEAPKAKKPRRGK